MINWICFPSHMPIPDHMNGVIEAFKTELINIDSDSNQVPSDEVLHIIEPHLAKIGYKVEKSKKKQDKIHITALYGENGTAKLSFDADAYNSENHTVIEVEAGRAVTNYQFLKDFYEACMMQDVETLCVAVRNQYRRNNDYETVKSFFESLYSSNRFQIPLKHIVIIGY